MISGRHDDHVGHRGFLVRQCLMSDGLVLRVPVLRGDHMKHSYFEVFVRFRSDDLL